MKKFLTLLLIVATFCCGTVFAACNNGEEKVNYSETFAGAISEEHYASEEEAAQNFLANEIDGRAIETKYVGMEKKSELTREQISELNTGDVLAETDEIVSAEIVDVKYTKADKTRSSETQDEETYFVFTVYIIVISPSGSAEYVYRYYVPKTQNGDVLTKSYYEDVFDPAKYTNFTQTFSYNSTTSAAGISMTLTSDYVIKLAGETASVAMHMNLPNPEAFPITYIDNYIDGYFENGENGFNAYLTTDNWSTFINDADAFKEYGVTNMDSFVTMCLPQYDYSYYVKTDYGFKLQSDFINDLVEDALNQTVGENAQVSAELNFYVVEGRLYKAIATASFTISNQGYNVYSYLNEEVRFDNFGTTTVEKPAALNS